MKYESINFFRGIAVLMVVFIHTYNFFDFGNSEYPADFLKYVEWGQYGVQFFFILSAFTLCNSFQYSLEKGEKNMIRNFYLKRFFRIYPLYLVILLVFLVYTNINHGSVYKFLNFIFLNNYYPPLGNRGIVSFSWTLNVEMTFYLLFPFIYRYFYPRHWLVFLPLLFDLFVQGLKALAKMYPQVALEIFRIRPEDLYPFTYRHLLMQMSVFLLGFLLYKALFDKEKKSRNLANISVGIMLASNLIFDYLSFHLAISCVFYFLVLILFRYDFSDWISVPIKRIGVCSYSIYLLHFFGIETVRFLGLGHLTGGRILDCCIRYGFVLIITWLASEITLRLIENPGINFGKRFLKR